MYIWVILATFLVALYSFNLTYRSDMRTVEVEPVARALISKLIIKQQAAGRYIRGNTPPYATISNPDGTVVSSDTLTYTSGIISTEDLQQSEGVSYLPYGFKDDGSVTAEIYCVDKNDLSLAKDCSSEDAIRYLVAYMTVPQRWLNIQTGLPNNDLNAAMKELVGYDSGFGYPVCKTYAEDPDGGNRICEELVIQGREGAYIKGYDDSGDGEITDDFMFEIPQYIAQNGGFSETCVKNSQNFCLMYIYEYKATYYNVR